MTTLFISDLHLDDSRPGMTAALLAFLEGEAREAERLYILGDLFEYWIGDDVLTETARQVAQGLSALAGSGVPIHYLHGNRDFLLGENYADQAGMALMADPTLVDLYGTPTLLLHGDTLCTDDVAYQAFRAQVRDPAFQADFLSREVPERVAMARAARDASQKHTGQADMAIMDVNADAVASAIDQAVARHGAAVPRMIHGHTHRPDIHQPVTTPGGQQFQRIVLGDWYEQGSVLRVDAQGVRLASLPAATP